MILGPHQSEWGIRLATPLLEAIGEVLRRAVEEDSQLKGAVWWEGTRRC